MESDGGNRLYLCGYLEPRAGDTETALLPAGRHTSLLDTPGTTLLDIRRVLSDDNWRTSLVRKVRDKETRQTWLEFSTKDAKQRAIEIGSLQNKIAALADPLPLRYVIGQPTSTIRIGRLLNLTTPLIVDLSDLGDEPAHLLGALIVSQFRLAAEARSQLPEDERRDFTLYIDEFQNFATRSFSKILSEARKWRLSLVLAHQFLDQIQDEQIREAVFGNCGTIVSFRVGPTDAPYIGKAVGCSPDTLLELGRGEAWARVLQDGQPSQGMPLRTEKVELRTGHLAANIANTRARYARPREMADRKPARTVTKWG